MPLTDVNLSMDESVLPDEISEFLRAADWRISQYFQSKTAGSSDALATRQSYKMVPGFHLIDRDFVLRRDSSGHHPVHNLYDDLLLTMGRLVSNATAADAKASPPLATE